MAFLEATLAMLESREGQGAEVPAIYRPVPPDLWRISDAVRRITELLGESPTGLPLQRCLPPIPRTAPDRPLRVQDALARTLIAELELARDGRAMLQQDDAFDAVLIGPVPA